jgi:hypothetical protein
MVFTNVTAGTASISAIYSGDANNVLSVSKIALDVRSAPPADDGPQVIPTLSPLTLLALGGLLAAFGALRHRR